MSQSTISHRGRGPAASVVAPSIARRALASIAGCAVETRVVYIGTVLYAALFVFAASVHYVTFDTSAADLGHMVQAIWSTLHGHFLEMTTIDGNQRTRLAFHVDPFLVLLVPFYLVWSSPLLLPVFQAIAVAAGAFPVYWLARKHLRSGRAGAHFAFAYLLYPATQFNAFTSPSSFHPVAIAVPLILFALWFLDEDRLVAFTIAALLAASTKEEIPLALGCLGLWYAVRTGRRWFGGIVFITGLALTLFDFLYVIPRFSPSGIDPFVGRYSDVGGTPRGIGHTLLSDPGALVHAVATGHKAVYVALLLVPFLGLWLLEPLLLLGALPDLAINLLSSKGDQTSIAYHWTAGIVPFVVAASIFGAARFRKRGVELSLWVMAGTAFIAAFSPISTLKLDGPALFSATTAAKQHALLLLPPDSPVSASNQLAAHLSERRYIYTFPTVRGAQWIALDKNDQTYGDAAGYTRVVRELNSSEDWRVVYAAHGVEVFQRIGSARR